MNGFARAFPAMVCLSLLAMILLVGSFVHNHMEVAYNILDFAARPVHMPVLGEVPGETWQWLAGGLSLGAVACVAVWLTGRLPSLKIILTVCLSAVDISLDMVTIFWKYWYQMGHVMWGTTGLLVLLMNPTYSAVGSWNGNIMAACRMAWDSVSNVPVLGLQCIRHGLSPESSKAFAEAKFQEVILETVPQFMLQSYCWSWMQEQQFVCPDVDQGSADWSYWKCEVMSDKMKASPLQVASLCCSFAVLIHGLADWGKSQYAKRGFQRGLHEWIFVVMCMMSLPMALLMPGVTALDSGEVIATTAVTVRVRGASFLAGMFLRFIILTNNVRIITIDKRMEMSWWRCMALCLAWEFVPMIMPLPGFGTLPANDLKKVLLMPWYVREWIEMTERTGGWKVTIYAQAFWLVWFYTWNVVSLVFLARAALTGDNSWIMGVRAWVLLLQTLPSLAQAAILTPSGEDVFSSSWAHVPGLDLTELPTGTAKYSELVPVEGPDVAEAPKEAAGSLGQLGSSPQAVR
eukprot:TRINITY_DN11496_c1_g1_i1.p1 TRINITY_DN11496_c1_g1~~TRINITY_DN11496_c1_g1_i1.p1  ORF type:complete len:567 (-),score=37.42 TRINITY_DN11496_c1_g1_i1:278-1828(-)